MQKMSEEIALYCLKADSESYSEVCEECSIYGNVGCDHCYNDAINMAIKALEELSLYKQGGLVLLPADVYQRQCDELDAYKATENELKERYHANVDIKMLMQYFIETIFKGEKHEGFRILTNEDAKMWDAYKAIGTVEELKELKDNGAFSGIELANIAVSLAELQKYQAIGTVEEVQADKFKMVLKRHGSLSNMVDALEEYHTIGSEDKCREAVERMKPKKPVEYEDKYYGCPKCANPLMHKWEKYPTILKPKSKGLPCCWNCLQVIDWSE